MAPKREGSLRHQSSSRRLSDASTPSSLSSRAAVGQHPRPQVDASLLSSATVQSVLVAGVLLLTVCSWCNYYEDVHVQSYNPAWAPKVHRVLGLNVVNAQGNVVDGNAVCILDRAWLRLYCFKLCSFFSRLSWPGKHLSQKSWLDVSYWHL